MWIRSQDKEKLVNLRVFDISKTNYANMPYKICGYSDDWANTNNFHIDLGHYSTKEKALKVLDLIQKYIGGMQEQKIIKEADDYYSITSKYDIPFNYCKDGIFQMPEDNKI